MRNSVRFFAHSPQTNRQQRVPHATPPPHFMPHHHPSAVSVQPPSPTCTWLSPAPAIWHLFLCFFNVYICLRSPSRIFILFLQFKEISTLFKKVEEKKAEPHKMQTRRLLAEIIKKLKRSNERLCFSFFAECGLFSTHTHSNDWMSRSQAVSMASANTSLRAEPRLSLRRN